MAPITYHNSISLPTTFHSNTQALHLVKNENLLWKISRRHAIDLPRHTVHSRRSKRMNDWAHERFSCSDVEKKCKVTSEIGDKICFVSLAPASNGGEKVLQHTFLCLTYRKNQIMILINRFSAQLSAVHIYILWLQPDVIRQHMMWVWHLNVCQRPKHD